MFSQPMAVFFLYISSARCNFLILAMFTSLLTKAAVLNNKQGQPNLVITNKISTVTPKL